jgi:hypothetical protein
MNDLERLRLTFPPPGRKVSVLGRLVAAPSFVLHNKE